MIIIDDELRVIDGYNRLCAILGYELEDYEEQDQTD